MKKRSCDAALEDLLANEYKTRSAEQLKPLPRDVMFQIHEIIHLGSFITLNPHMLLTEQQPSL